MRNKIYRQKISSKKLVKLKYFFYAEDNLPPNSILGKKFIKLLK